MHDRRVYLGGWNEAKPRQGHTCLTPNGNAARLEEDETRRVFYVAPTRARDHLILTCTGLTERLCGLTVLQPGLELAGIPVSLVPYDPRDAQPPELPSPSPAEPAGLLLAPVG